MTFRTKSQNYILPNRADMREAADSVNLKSFSPELVEDLCNLASGGELRLPSDYRAEIERELTSLLDTDGDGDYKLGDRYARPYTQDLREAIAFFSEERLAYHQKVQDFLRSLDFSKIPGDCPLEQSMNLLKLLASQEGGEGSGDNLPIFSDSETSGESVASKLMEAIDAAESLTDVEAGLLDMEGASTVEIAEEMLAGKEEILKISRQLDKLVKFKVARINKFERDPEGDDVRYRPMKDLSEMGAMHPTEWAYPKNYRNYRMVTGQAAVKERVKRIERKQYLCLSIDCSGSMKSDNRFWKAGGVLMNRLKAVVAGDAELTVLFFDDRVRKELNATTPEEAKKLMKEIRKSNFSGSGTEISKCTKDASDRIEQKLLENPHLCKPELVVVTDGDDNTSDLSVDSLSGTRLHAFLVGGKNSHLTNVARQSGGVGIDSL